MLMPLAAVMRARTGGRRALRAPEVGALLEDVTAVAAVITTRRPYVARLSFTLWQSCYPLGQWAAKKFKRVYTLVSDFGPGHDCEDAIVRATKESGGEVAGTVRVPLVNPDFVPYMQRVKDAKPDAPAVLI